MQTLIFRTKEKTTELRDLNDPSVSPPYMNINLFSFKNVSTVAVRENYYEIMQVNPLGKTIPVARLPIHNTNMLIIDE